jgi:hypothetical protein
VFCPKSLEKGDQSMFTAEEKELIIYGLQMRKNVIETGDHNLSAIDAERIQSNHTNKGLYSLYATHAKVRALTVEQMKIVIAIDELIKKIMHM